MQYLKPDYLILNLLATSIKIVGYESAITIEVNLVLFYFSLKEGNVPPWISKQPCAHCESALYVRQIIRYTLRAVQTLGYRPKKMKKTQTVHTYVLLPQKRTVTYYIKDTISHQGERPTTNKTTTVLTTTKI